MQAGTMKIGNMRIYGLWVWECHGYVCLGNTFIHGILMEVLHTSMWPLAVISVGRKRGCYSSFLWAATDGPMTSPAKVMYIKTSQMEHDIV